MFQSPLKTVAEKIKPVDSKSSISSLRFERSSDFKKFIRFIKDETEQLEKIKLPSVTEVKPKSKAPSALGLFGLGFITLLTSAFGGGDGKKNFEIAGGTKSQFKPPELPLVGGLVNDNLTKPKTRVDQVSKSLREDRLRKFRKERKIKKEKVTKLKVDVTKNKRKFRTVDKKFTRQKMLNSLLDDLLRAAKESVDPKAVDFAGKSISAQRQIDQFMTLEIFKNLKGLTKGVDDQKIKDLENILLNLEDKDLRSTFGTYTQEEIDAAKELIKEREKKLRELEKQTLKFRGDPNLKIGKFSPKDFLDKQIFTKIGKFTKPTRDTVSNLIGKIPGSKTTGAFVGKNLLRFGKGVDFLTAGIEAVKLIDGFIVGDNILTAFYDLGVAFHNTFQPDKSKLKFFITKSRNAEKNRFIDKKNKKVLDAINKAKAAQGITNQVQANSGNSPSGGIIPFVKSATNTPFSITLTPAVFGIKFITEKLYKQ